MKKSTLKVIAAVSVVGALAISLGAVSSWFTNWDTKTWFGRGGSSAVKQPDKPDVPEPPEEEYKVFAYDDNGNGVQDGSDMPLHMTFFRSTQSLAAYSTTASITLTASITPSEAEFKTVTWTAKYIDDTVNKTVTDYITVTPVADTSLIATVECKQAFADKIEIVCSVTDIYDDTNTATCSLDYLSQVNRVRSLKYSRRTTDGVTHPEQTATYTGAPIQLDMYSSGSKQYGYTVNSIEFGWTVGTVRDDVSTEILDINVTYYCPHVASAKSWDKGKAATSLDLLSYIFVHATERTGIACTFQV